VFSSNVKHLKRKTCLNFTQLFASDIVLNRIIVAKRSCVDISHIRYCSSQQSLLYSCFVASQAEDFTEEAHRICTTRNIEDLAKQKSETTSLCEETCTKKEN